MNRRNFLTFVGVGWVVSSLPVAIAACASEKTSNGWQKVGKVGDLDNAGQLLVKK
ncbi:hypothetical protein [Aetokthonos hydrillicola]|jgi:cytochrome b6-f complex iron-sulfur subunit|uniref:hypothetical protein n=1 Tax=Aetokthonos hydrillicola TaxID=1550245 RepID=UPI001ABB3F80|nr:hypothetical protein [Aetokthonos hydrillicola]MBO3458382.1 hypothetical protein [Aetokthonos hydrillicola CCALA 1050]MBW4586078.1 hypothetical protein [Aetokthonos hydrillicola CCALA 1050]